MIRGGLGILRSCEGEYGLRWGISRFRSTCRKHFGAVVAGSQEGVALAIERLSGIGYTHRGNLGIDGREAFRAGRNVPAHHLYVCREDSGALRDHLTFRDYLRTHPETARAYGDLKRKLARQFPEDVDSYATAKTDFVTGVLDGKTGFKGNLFRKTAYSIQTGDWIA